ncbi:MAG: phosphatase PAP2 family protein [Methanotrichaceae archaeon]|nr:phosphatase PAP2 family protein [Methanotrichaceae archaeon]
MDTGIGLIPILQNQGWAFPLMKFVSFLGALEFFILFMPLFYWCWDARLGFRVGLILILSQGLNSALKIAFHSPRPYWISQEVVPSDSGSSFGMPSGHAQDAVCVWGLIASYIQRPWAWATALGIILLIGISRIYLGVHFPGDVIVGWAIGALLLAAFLISEPFVSQRLKKLNLKQQVLTSFLASVGIIGLYSVSWAAMDGWQMPTAWAANALETTGESINPLNPLEAFEAAGMLFGIAAGYALLLSKGGFKAKGCAINRLICYVIGSVCLIVIWFGLGMIHLEIPAGFAVAYISSMLSGAWVTVGAPLLFIRLKLAERENDLP